MKKVIVNLFLIGFIVSSCSTTEPITKAVAYKGFYEEKPITILFMPPINRSTDVEAKDFFHTTLHVPIANAGYYVIPPFLSIEILKKESAYDAELFLNASLNKFREVFGADLVLFTIIHKWDKSVIASKVYVEIEYIFKSTKTNEIVYSRKGRINYDTSVQSGMGGWIGLLVDVTASAVKTAATSYVSVASKCNSYTLDDMPAGKYSPQYGQDTSSLAGKKEFKVNL